MEYILSTWYVKKQSFFLTLLTEVYEAQETYICKQYKQKLGEKLNNIFVFRMEKS